MTPHLAQEFLSAAAGMFVGCSLGLIGGGGSVLGVPLMVYLVRVPDPHVAIGTSALGVAVNAALSLAEHARAGSVKWRCGAMYALAGVIGAWLGSSLGKIVDGQRLLFFFALVMIVIGVVMLRRRAEAGEPGAECTVEKAPKVLSYGLVTGISSGLFGIGGGFLIVPGLLRSTGMPMFNAIGTSLIAVTAFGLTTALNYAASSLIECRRWRDRQRVRRARRAAARRGDRPSRDPFRDNRLWRRHLYAGADSKRLETARKWLLGRGGRNPTSGRGHERSAP